MLNPDLSTKLQSITTVIFDVDGTLAREEGFVSDRTKDALKLAADAGLNIMVASGRIIVDIQRLFDGFDGYAIGCNGGITLDTATDTIVTLSPLSAESLEKAIALSEDTGYELSVFGHTQMYAGRPGPGADLLRELNIGVNVVETDLRALDADEPIKVMFYSSVDDMPDLKKRVLEIFPHAVQTLPNFMETNDEHVNKWTAISPLLHKLNIDPDNVLGIGDSENDLSWLPQIGVALAMENAYPHVKEVCDGVIGSNDNDGVAEFLENWLGR